MTPELLTYLQSLLTPRRRALFSQVLEQRTRHFTVVTEDVYQMHNTSAVMRSCDVFGIQDLHVIEARFGKRVDKEIAMGAQKWVDIHRHSNTEDCLKQLRAQGYQIVATTPHDGVSLNAFDVSRKSALLFGTEKKGLSPELMAQADVALTIPMYGFTESLNISVSAAIILNELVGRMRREEAPWALSPEERYKLECDWTVASIKDAPRIIERYNQDNAR
jgi:tRNA (guanosine-2'-O-)-methyltransferase